MRTIKFRAWDKEEKRMIVDANEDIKIYFNGALSKNGVWVTRFYELMQFTGLKDKNGKEIYEGDILQATPNGYEPRPLFKIVWDEHECRFEAMFRDSLNGNWELKRHIPDVVYMKIIGNIYENPELLKAKEE